VLEEDELDLELDPVDAGLIFRAEMWATNAFMGYWKHLLAFLIVMLLTILFYGQYHNWYQNEQRRSSHEIFAVLKDLGESPTDEQSNQAGDTLTELAGSARGLAKAEALLRAAVFYRSSGNGEGQREALGLLIADAPEGVVAFAGRSAMASLEIEEGNHDAAVSHLIWLHDNTSYFLSEQAGSDLGLVYEDLERNDEARALYTAMLADMQDGLRREMIEDRLSKLGEASP
jgi:predicted negative regulator of RcsB-dependent stress response